MKIYLLEHRQKKKISTRKLATLSNVSRAYIIKIEKGESVPTLNILCKLANALEIEVHKLFDC